VRAASVNGTSDINIFINARRSSNTNTMLSAIEGDMHGNLETQPDDFPVTRSKREITLQLTIDPLSNR